MADKKIKIGLFGGSFDPVHNGHISLAVDAKKMAGLDEVIFIPTYVQPFKQDSKAADCNHRLNMLNDAIKHEECISVSDYELNCPGVSYTYKTLRYFAEKYGRNAEIYFICGTDSFLKIEKWRNAEEILTEYSYIIGTRPGYKTDELSQVIDSVRKKFHTNVLKIDNKLVDVSSSEVRKCVKDIAVKNGIKAKDPQADPPENRLRRMVPECVENYIRKNGLYCCCRADNMDNNRIKSIDEYLKKHLKESRYRHTLGVVKLAGELAEKYGADKDKAMLAAKLHDVCKSDEYPVDTMNEYVLRFDLDNRYINNTRLAHSKVASRIIPEKFGINDREVLDAIDCHTTGKPAMSMLEKIVFIADATEEGRDYPGVSELRKLAFDNIDKACFKAMDETIELVKSRGQYLDEDSVIARNYYLNQGETDGN